MSDENNSTKIYLETAKNIQMDRKQFQKMMFITNALDNGWTVKKRNDKYIFTKKHENQRKIFQETYLEEFIIQNCQPNVTVGL
jgi:hypothetical protein